MTEEPKRRGPKKGATYAKLVEKVCQNTIDCPREGKPFMATAKAKYCNDQTCGMRARRRKEQSADGV